MNCYRVPARLFVFGGTELASREGTTQGCPLAMAMYALAIMPLIDILRHPPEGKENSAMPAEKEGDAVKQAWFADDSQAAARLRDLRRWWEAINEYGPRYGYFTNPGKTVVIVKPKQLELANQLFGKEGIKISATVDIDILELPLEVMHS